MSILDKFKKKLGGASAKQSSKKTDADRAKFASVGAAAPQAESQGTRPLKRGVHGFGDIDRVLIGSVITEKATMLRSKGHYVFEVEASVNKAMVRRAFAMYYGVNPKRVRMISLPGKAVRYGKTKGVTKRRKKVIVTLPKGTNIEV